MLPEATLEKLRGEYGSIHVREAAGETVVLRGPNRAEWNAFQAKAADENKRHKAPEALLRSCVVYPPPTDFDAMLDRKPGLVITFGTELMEIAGVVKDVEKKDY